MSIPPSMLESLQRHGNDSDLLAPQIDAVSTPMVEGSSNALPWRMVEYDVDVRDLKITGWVMLGFSILMLCIAPLWATPSPDERTLSPRLLLTFGPLVILTLAVGVYSLWLAHSPAKRSRIILESDRLVYQRSLGRQAREVLYRQICWVDLSEKRHRVRIKYYPIDGTGQLVATRLLWLTLPRTEDDEHLNTILKQRAFGPPPSFRAKGYGILGIGLSAIGWMILIVMIMSVYAIFLQGVPWY